MILHVAIDGRLRKLMLEKKPDGSFSCEVDGEPWTGSARLLEPGILSLLIGEESYRCVLDGNPDEHAIYVNGQRYQFRLEDPRSWKTRRSRGEAERGPRSIKAPMPGRVIRILINQGDQVDAQQGIVVIEAMKMQNELKAPKAGRVSELRVAAGETVNAGDVLAVIE